MAGFPLQDKTTNTTQAYFFFNKEVPGNSSGQRLPRVPTGIHNIVYMTHFINVFLK